MVSAGDHVVHHRHHGTWSLAACYLNYCNGNLELCGSEGQNPDGFWERDRFEQDVFQVPLKLLMN